MEVMIILACAAAAYLIGSISSAVIISKAISGKDIRSEGSGNAGATNMLRVHGKGAGALTLVIDVLKGVLAVLSAIIFEKFLSGVAPESIFLGNLKYIAGLFVVLGHDFPIFFKFRGGKGVATSLGVILMLNWIIGVLMLVIALLVMVISKYVSLGSITAAVVYVIFVLGFMTAAKEFNNIQIITAVIMALLLIVKHHANIVRLLKGTESRLFSKKK